MIYRIVGVIIILSWLGGCASVPMANQAEDNLFKEFKIGAGVSGLYIYRNESLGVRMNVTVDGIALGQTAYKTYFYTEVDPGYHKITSESEGVDSRLDIYTEAGKLYYIWQEMKTGMWKPRTMLRQVSEAVGRSGVQESKLIKSSMTKVKDTMHRIQVDEISGDKKYPELVKAVLVGDREMFRAAYNKQPNLYVMQGGLNVMQLAAVNGQDHLIQLMMELDPDTMSKNATDILKRRLLFEKWSDGFGYINETKAIVDEVSKLDLQTIQNEFYRTPDVVFCTYILRSYKALSNRNIVKSALSFSKKFTKHTREQIKYAGVDTSLSGFAKVLANTLIPLFKLGADPNVDLGNGVTPLHVFSAMANKYRIELMLNAGANINARDASGRTPLHYAFPTSTVELGQEKKDIIAYLIENRADPDIKDAEGLTPSETYIKGRQKYLQSLAMAEVQMTKRKAEQQRVAALKQSRREAAEERKIEEEEERRQREAERKAAETRDNWQAAAAFAQNFSSALKNNVAQIESRHNRQREKINRDEARIDENNKRRNAGIATRKEENNWNRNASISARDNNQKELAAREKTNRQIQSTASSTNDFMASLSKKNVTNSSSNDDDKKPNSQKTQKGKRQKLWPVLDTAVDIVADIGFTGNAAYSSFKDNAYLLLGKSCSSQGWSGIERNTIKHIAKCTTSGDETNYRCNGSARGFCYKYGIPGEDPNATTRQPRPANQPDPECSNGCNTLGH